MPIPARLSHTLHQKLGDQAGNDLVDWMHTVDEHRVELRELFELHSARYDARLNEVRHELYAKIAEVKHDLSAEIADVRQEMRVGFADMRTALSGVESKIDRRFADLMKWSFLFWCGAVAAAMLARR